MTLSQTQQCFGYEEIQEEAFQYLLENKAEIPGDVITSQFTNNNDVNPPTDESTCNKSNKQKRKDRKKNKNKKENRQFQLVFMGEVGGTSPSTFENIHQTNPNSINAIPISEDPNFKNLNTRPLSEINTSIDNMALNSPSVAREDIIADFLVVGASQFYNPDQNNNYDYEKQVTDWAASVIKSQNLSEDQSLAVIANVMERLYFNYNDGRNFTSTADNDNRFFSQMSAGLITGNELQGGVCDDISAVGCTLYNSLYPDKDCLIMNISRPSLGDPKDIGVQHQVMIVGNGTTDYKMIDGGTINRTQNNNFINANPDNTILSQDQSMFIKLEKVENGKIRDLYVQKTEYGQFMDNLMSNNQDLPGESITKNLNARQYKSIMGGAYNEWKKNEKTKRVDYGGGSLNQADGSQVYAVYARYSKDKNGKGGFSIALSGAQVNKEYNATTSAIDGIFDVTQSTSGGSEQLRGQINISGYKGQTFYLNPSWSLKAKEFYNFTGFAGLGGTTFGTQTTTTNINTPYGVFSNSYNRDLTNTVGMNFDGNLSTGLRTDLQYRSPSSNFNMNLGVQETLYLGSNNYGGMHAFNNMGQVTTSLSNLRFRHQSLEVKLDTNAKTSANTSFITSTEYLGTNVGQNVSTKVGLQIDAPKGIEVLVYTGYRDAFGGYQTKENWLNRPQTGVIAGAAVNTKNKRLSFMAEGTYDPKNKGATVYGKVVIRPFKVKKNFRVPSGE